MTPTLSLSIELLQKPSITPNDENCQDIIYQRLQKYGFNGEFMYFGEPNNPASEVKNLWLKRGNQGPLICFLGHTDVVPVGDENSWTYPPFSATIADGMLYGRGAADMKTAIACFVIACENFINKHPNHKGSIALLLTADEEGVATHGTVKVAQTLQNRQEKIDYCLVGEPSSTKILGDVIKNGRRGSLNGVLTVTGKQGHVAYPHLAVNPIHDALTALDELLSVVWDNGNDYFPPTSLQISNIHAGTGANNVIPKTLHVEFNFRFSTEQNESGLKQAVHDIFDKHFANKKADYHIDWKLSGNPFLTEKGVLVDACENAIKKVTGTKTTLSTAGGTSDGRFIAPMGAEVVELGVLNATIHQANENVAIADLEKLTQIYELILENLLL